MVQLSVDNEDHDNDDDYDDYQDVDLPTAFTCSTLDTNEDHAATAGHRFDHIERDLVDLHGTLELYERALRESEPHSERAKRARAAVQDTLDALEPIFIGVDRARSAITLGWGTPPRAARYPPASQATQ